MTRMACSWGECVTLFTEELPWLTPQDKELIMGRALVNAATRHGNSRLRYTAPRYKISLVEVCHHGYEETRHDRGT